MTDGVSNELRDVERQVDTEYLNNPLVSAPFADAAWHFFVHFEDHFARQYVHAADGEVHYHALADNLINHSRWALSWLKKTCAMGKSKRPVFNDELYGHAMKLSELAQDYRSFATAYTYASHGLVDLRLEANRIRSSGPMIDDVQYEAYDHAVIKKPDPSVFDNFDPSFMEQIYASLNVRGHLFDYKLNPKVMKHAVEALGPTIDARFSLTR